MKMTPEQKAFRDYGMALGELKRLRKEVVFYLSYFRDIEKNEALLIFRKRFSSRNILIKEAWQKRAACRAWMIRCSERTSKNCIHGSKSRYKMPCRECFRSAYALQSEMVGDNWEPRKEGK